MMSISGMAITLFLGGWNAPFPFLTSGAVVSLVLRQSFRADLRFIWIRGTSAKVRMDQLNGFAWRFMLPMALVNLVTAGIWRFLPEGLFVGWYAVRWLLRHMFCWDLFGLKKLGKAGLSACRVSADWAEQACCRASEIVMRVTL